MKNTWMLHWIIPRKSWQPLSFSTFSLNSWNRTSLPPTEIDCSIAIKFFPRLRRCKKIVHEYLAPIIEIRRSLDEQSKPVTLTFWCANVCRMTFCSIWWMLLRGYKHKQTPCPFDYYSWTFQQFIPHLSYKPPTVHTRYGHWRCRHWHMRFIILPLIGSTWTFFVRKSKRLWERKVGHIQVFLRCEN